MKITPCKTTLEEKLEASAKFEAQRQAAEKAPKTTDSWGLPIETINVPAEARNVQKVRLTGIAAVACWMFVILSFVGIVVAIIVVSSR
jgi:hypothetical protein